MDASTSCSRTNWSIRGCRPKCWYVGRSTQVTVTLVEVTNKKNPQWVGAWYDADHPSGRTTSTPMSSTESGTSSSPTRTTTRAMSDRETHAGHNHRAPELRRAQRPASHPQGRRGRGELGDNSGGWIYIHDMTVQTWPGTIQMTLASARPTCMGPIGRLGLGSLT